MTTRESGSDRMSCSLQGDDAVTQASDAARAFGELQWLGEDELARLSIVIEELIANLYDHGGVSRDQEVRLELASEPEGIRVTIIDPGTPFDPRQPLFRDRPERGGGAGIDIVRAWAQLVSYETTDDGNRLELFLPLLT
jgi:anti-sigma regulatory factor (Ser/Thr protein kinase)